MSIIEEKNDAADTKLASTTPKKSESVARREAIKAMSEIQIATLWDALCAGEQPADMNATIETIASAIEAAA